MVKSLITIIVFLVLGLVVTYIVGLGDFLINKSSIVLGFPFGFSDIGFFFGGGSTDYMFLFIDIVFWAGVLFGMWVLIKKLLKK